MDHLPYCFPGSPIWVTQENSNQLIISLVIVLRYSMCQSQELKSPGSILNLGLFSPFLS